MSENPDRDLERAISLESTGITNSLVAGGLFAVVMMAAVSALTRLITALRGTEQRRGADKAGQVPSDSS